MALVIAIGKIAISIISAFAIVYFRFPLRKTAFWMIFITLMLPVEVRILPTYQVADEPGAHRHLRRTDAAADRLGDRDLPVSPVLPHDPRRIRRGRPYRRRRAAALFQGRDLAALAHQYHRPVRDHVHLWLEPVPVAAAGDDAGEHVHDRDRHQAHDPRRRCGSRVAPGDGHCHAGDAAARAGRAADAGTGSVKGLVDTEK